MQKKLVCIPRAHKSHGVTHSSGKKKERVSDRGKHHLKDSEISNTVRF